MCEKMKQNPNEANRFCFLYKHVIFHQFMATESGVEW